MSSQPLTLHKFRRWLWRQSPRRRFTTRDASCCPIARFLQAERGVSATAYLDHYRVPVKGQYKRASHKTPAWASRFMTAVDRYGFKLSTAKAKELLLENAYRRA